MSPLAVYVHVPFCPSKCGYCDFNSYAMDGDIIGRTVNAIETDIRRSPHAGRPAKTIFFGGGTPTYLAVEDLNRLLEAVMEVHPPLPDCEITSEANPGTVDASKFTAMRAAGFNRISLGAQSFLDDDLIRLDRVHRASEIERAVGSAREASFDNLNLDLMFALPDQSRFGWSKNLETALRLAPEHLSLYCLTIEPNTAFYKKHLHGQLNLPDEEVQVAMYEECLQRTAEAGYEQYEISNFARSGLECRHNLEYWYGHEYAAYGPGAVGQVGGRRFTNLKHPKGYCDAVESGSPLAFESEELDADMQRTEQIMLGLRLNEGIPLRWVESRAAQEVERLGWVELGHDRIRLTPHGRHFCSEVAMRLM
jgi:oxygen-independent coproporphyrinogen III oxidase